MAFVHVTRFCSLNSFQWLGLVGILMIILFKGAFSPRGYWGIPPMKIVIEYIGQHPILQCL